jgi:hypothetical protein
MNPRRFRHDSTQRLAEARWWGCVLLAMFALVQTARGPVESRPPLEHARAESARPSSKVMWTNAADTLRVSKRERNPLLLDAPYNWNDAVFGGTSPFDAARIRSAALADYSTGALGIQTP